jgi:RNA-directed DNA polymerase
MVNTVAQRSQAGQQMPGAQAPDAPARLPQMRTPRWEAIDWGNVRAEVHRLQRRIAKAVQAGKPRKAKALQWLLTHSRSAKLMAVKRVTTNNGKRTPGVDGVLWTTPEAKLQATQQLTRRGYHPLPLRRLYIPKTNGKLRPLGIPTMRDRAMQALHLLALAPVAETQADPNSYGFRAYRGCADAIEQAFICLARRTSGTQVLEGDITACFDEISHPWLCAHVLMDRRILRQWLAAGYVWQGTLFPTTAGTPQGGVISPTLANIALDGLEDCVHQAAAPHTAHFIRYADDFLVITRERVVLEEQVKPAIHTFLRERGLTLSVKKTVITSIRDGFDFLGQHLRKYGQRGTLLITPAKPNVQRFLNSIRHYIDTGYHRTREELVSGLNKKIRGWANYHRHICAKATFSSVDNLIWHALFRRERRMNPTMGARTILRRYFAYGPYRSARRSSSAGGTETHLVRAAHIPIVRHIKVKAKAHPYAAADAAYFAARRRQRNQHRGTPPKATTTMPAASKHDWGEQRQGSSDPEA